MISLISIGFAVAKKILSGHYDELSSLLKQLESFELSAEVVQPIIDNVLAKKDNIYQAALQIAGK
jgi:hypothetical protein